MAAADPLPALLAYWVAMTAAMLLSTVVPVLGRLSRYGKLAASRPAGQTPARWPALPEVRTATAFRSYYWLACAFSLGLLGAMSLRWSGATPPLPLPESRWMREALTPLSEAERDQRDGDSLLALALLAVHVATRLAETYYVHAFSNSRQSVLVTAMGLSYYAALFLTLALDSTLLLREAPPPGPLLAPAHHKVGLVLFGFGYYVQRRAHAALAALRKGTVEGAPARYEIPRAPVFQFVSCPHYSAEIVLYAGILVIRRGALSQCLIMLWVAGNLCVTGFRTHQLYLTRFGEAYKKLRRSAVVPLLL